MAERLQKLIAQAGLASRRQAEAWITEGRVLLNGEVAKLGDRADLSTDQLLVDGRRLGNAEEQVTLLLNKPRGYVSTLKDPQGRKLVTDLITGLSQRLYPVGRLDYNTEGLLLLTNDGDLAQHLAHPRHHVEKTYLVKASGQLNSKTRQQLESGVSLDDGMTLPAKLENVRTSGQFCWFELTIREGRNRQVRRMCEQLGVPVVRLKRIRVGFLELAGIKTGSYRRLTAAEVERLKRL
ncbi:MAG TPA: pseudouridine synthase [Malonomonas sp.]